MTSLAQGNIRDDNTETLHHCDAEKAFRKVIVVRLDGTILSAAVFLSKITKHRYMKDGVHYSRIADFLVLQFSHKHKMRLSEPQSQAKAGTKRGRSAASNGAKKGPKVAGASSPLIRNTSGPDKGAGKRSGTINNYFLPVRPIKQHKSSYPYLSQTSCVGCCNPVPVSVGLFATACYSRTHKK